MRIIFLTFLLLVTFNLVGEDPFVDIYKTHDNGMFGRSQDRDINLLIEESVFKRYLTVPVDEEMNFLTAVVLSTKTKKALESLFKSNNTAQIGFVKITKEKNIYTVEDDNIFLSFSFSLEKPNNNVLDIIDSHYARKPVLGKKVINHYKDNFIIRIHSAENIINPEVDEITYDEALIVATIIGDKTQWLWGIHDGKGYMESLLFK